MRHKYSDKPVQFFYIQRNADNHLLHGITVSDSKFLTSFPVWKPPRSFDWARPVRHRRQRGGAQGCLIVKDGRLVISCLPEFEKDMIWMYQRGGSGVNEGAWKSAEKD